MINYEIVFNNANPQNVSDPGGGVLCVDGVCKQILDRDLVKKSRIPTLTWCRMIDMWQLTPSMSVRELARTLKIDRASCRVMWRAIQRFEWDIETYRIVGLYVNIRRCGDGKVRRNRRSGSLVGGAGGAYIEGVDVRAGWVDGRVRNGRPRGAKDRVPGSRVAARVRKAAERARKVATNGINNSVNRVTNVTQNESILVSEGCV